jgi:hypothetical protein
MLTLSMRNRPFLSISTPRRGWAQSSRPTWAHEEP